jgi:translation initiation factor IF-3
MARGLDLDLVEVAPMANPPVCRIMDYGKFRYEEAQKAKEARRKSIHVTVKEVKFRPKIGKGDFDTKMRHLKEFLEEGHKVKVTLQFRGREVAHPELGRKILDDVIVALGPTAKVENQARMEGRNMTLVLAPDKKAQDALRKAAEAERRSTSTASQPDVSEPDVVGETDEVSANNEVSETNEDHEPIDAERADPAEASVASEPAAPHAGDE